MGSDQRAPTMGYCSGCRVERRLSFAGFASDGRENSVRPRAFYRSCRSCSTMMLVLGDAPDAMSLVRNAIADYQRATGVSPHATGNPAHRTIDFDDLAGELLLVLWRLYADWDPARLTFVSYASGLLPRRIQSYVRDAVGSDSLYRSNGRGLVRVWPKAHATSVCDSIDGAAAAGADEDGDGDRPRARLDASLAAGGQHGPADRSPDLARLLAVRGR